MTLRGPANPAYWPRTVLIFDNRGIGSSYIPKEKAGDTYDVHDMANDVVELVKVRTARCTSREEGELTGFPS